MLSVHGFAVSNYHNMVRMALMEKGVDFRIVEAFPSQDDLFLGRSPMGKVPVLETPQGFLAETSVILEYIEDTVPGPRLLPQDPFERARVRQAMKMIELYIELPARRLLPGVLMGGENPAQTVSEVEPALRKGVAALGRILECRPFVMGSDLSLADVIAAFAFPVASMVTRSVYGWHLAEAVPGLPATLASLAERPSVRQLSAEADAGMAAFRARLRARHAPSG